MAPPRSKKKSLGRRKIEMKLIEDENARTVTFSKRRAGLFKKANELSILCGTQIALIIFSLGGRAYSFGHPDVESIINRFLNRTPVPTPPESAHAMRARAAMLQEIKGQMDQKSEQLEKKKQRGKEIEGILESSSYQTTEERLDGLDYHQLEQLKEKLEALRDQLHHLVNTPRVNAAGEPAVAGRAGAVKPPNFMDVAGPSSLGPLNLAKVGRKERGASPIPPDWLKL